MCIEFSQNLNLTVRRKGEEIELIGFTGEANGKDSRNIMRNITKSLGGST